MSYDQLKLANQLCFPVYAASRLITKEYQPLLHELGITYPQYLVLLVLWEHEQMPVNNIAKRLILNTNTITPLLKRMECEGLVNRMRDEGDERKVIVHLTEKGMQLRERAAKIPDTLVQNVLEGPLDLNDLVRLKEGLVQLIAHLSKK